MITFFVPGVPRPQGSKSRDRDGNMYESSRGLRPWRDAVGWIARARNTQAMQDGPFAVHCRFVMPRPQAMAKTKPTPPHTKKPDVDKIARAILDAITGVWFKDDSQVTCLVATKRYAEFGEKPGVHITVCRPEAMEV